jgi:CDP-alcohol phosphatidyltransferase-like enzyme
VTEHEELATKGEAVEEWLDLRFFRPLGAHIARAAYGTRISPDHLTLASLGIGLVAGHMFFYASPAVNAMGFVLFIISDVFDSADGQLARLRGTSTRFGRIVDGLSDNARFINLYAHLLARLVDAGWVPAAALGLVLAAGLSHSTQSGAVDFVRHAFLAIGVGRGSELASDEQLDATAGGSWFRRAALRVYRAYTVRQERMFPRTWALVDRAEHGALSAVARAAYRQRVSPWLGVCAWLGQNIRFVLVAATCIAGWPAGALWVTAVPMNAILVALVFGQERATARVVATASPPVAAPWHIAGR